LQTPWLKWEQGAEPPPPPSPLTLTTASDRLTLSTSTQDIQQQQAASRSPGSEHAHSKDAAKQTGYSMFNQLNSIRVQWLNHQLYKHRTDIAQ